MNIAKMFEGPAHNLVWMNHFNEIMGDVYKNYGDSHTTFLNGFAMVKPMEHSKETFINECKSNKEFAKKWGVKITERNLSDKERIELMGGKFSVFQENYPNTHKRNDPNGLLDAFDIPTKIITLEYKNEIVEYYE